VDSSEVESLTLSESGRSVGLAWSLGTVSTQGSYRVEVLILVLFLKLPLDLSRPR
jgi:hypothetical protein